MTTSIRSLSMLVAAGSLLIASSTLGGLPILLMQMLDCHFKGAITVISFTCFQETVCCLCGVQKCTLIFGRFDVWTWFIGTSSVECAHENTIKHQMASYGIHLYCPNLSAATRQSVFDHWGSLSEVFLSASADLYISIRIYIYINNIYTHMILVPVGWKSSFLPLCIFFFNFPVIVEFVRKISQIMASSWLAVAIKADPWTVKWQRYGFGFSEDFR